MRLLGQDRVEHAGVVEKTWGFLSWRRRLKRVPPLSRRSARHRAGDRRAHSGAYGGELTRMAKARIPAIAYLRTSSAANVGADKDSDTRQAIGIDALAAARASTQQQTPSPRRRSRRS